MRYKKSQIGFDIFLVTRKISDKTDLVFLHKDYVIKNDTLVQSIHWGKSSLSKQNQSTILFIFENVK